MNEKIILNLLWNWWIKEKVIEFSKLKYFSATQLWHDYNISQSFKITRTFLLYLLFHYFLICRNELSNEKKFSLVCSHTVYVIDDHRLLNTSFFCLLFEKGKMNKLKWTSIFIYIELCVSEIRMTPLTIIDIRIFNPDFWWNENKFELHIALNKLWNLICFSFDRENIEKRLSLVSLRGRTRPHY